MNAAVFFNQYEDIIFTNNQPTPNSPSNATPTNAGDADVKGAELEIEARPMQGLSIQGVGQLSRLRAHPRCRRHHDGEPEHEADLRA